MSDLTQEEREKIFNEEMAKKEKQSKNYKGCGCLIFIVLAIALFISTCVGGGTPAPEHDAISAYVMAQDFVEAELKAPKTADFPYSGDADIQYSGDGRYTINSYVDSENSFGATIRTYFTAVVKYQGNQKWTLENLNLK